MRRLFVLASFALITVIVAASACDSANAKDSAAKPSTPSDEATKPSDEATKSGVAKVEAGGRIDVKVDGQGYHPAEIQAPANAKITLAFKRVDEQNCGETLVIESLAIKKDLPVGKVVEVAITTPAAGEVGFACGMDMYKGKVVVAGK
ncbi:cupredoxin domain-containing protein [Nannocystaceae bacterium ST9]